MSSALSLFSTPDTVKPKKPRKTTKATGPPVEDFTVEKTNYSPSVEGFQANRVFPSYTGPSIHFQRNMMDIFYKQYNATNLQPNPELVSLLNSIQTPPPDLPNYGAQLSNFDAGSIDSIPWDADNATSLKTDIVWGHVTLDASKSIFSKLYHSNLASDPANLNTTGDNVLYRSAMFPISATSPGDAVLLQISDAVGMVAGQMAVNAASDAVADILKLGLSDDIVAKLERSKKGVTDPVKLAAIDDDIKKVRDAKSDFLKQQDDIIKAKEQQKIPLTNEEKITKAVAAAEDAKNGKALSAAGSKVEVKLSVIDKMKMGVQKAKDLAKSLKNAIKNTLTRVFSSFFTEFLIKTAVIKGTLVGMTSALGAATAVTFGALTPLLAIVSAITVAYNILDGVCMVLSIALMVILPALFEKALANGGVCEEGRPIDQIISDEFLYFLFSTFCPIGGLMDAFGPYICYKGDGTPTLKKPLFIPAYFSDASLSIFKHAYSVAETPRGDSTSYVSGVPTDWPIVGGIAREACVAGTWTSSDVDMLCNISTYVPRTYPKRSAVPPTVVKASNVPATTVKDSFVATRINSQVRTVRIPNRAPCGPGLRDTDLTGNNIGDCWDDLKCTTNCSGDWNPSTWRCNTSCTGCACVRTWSWDRENCNFGDGKTYDRYLSLCRSDCPAGTSAPTRIDLFCKNPCSSNETDWVVLPFCTGNNDQWCLDNKPAGKTGTNWKMVAGVCWQRNCGPGETDVGALCRAGCGNRREVLGVCWDSCPPGTSDQGALCRYNCGSGGLPPHDVAGVCWGDCGNDIDVGALCRERCKDGFHEVAGVCWGNIGTYARRSMIPKSIKVYDPGYNPPKNLSDVSFPWCDFGNPIMLDRMAQFYYDQSTLNPQQLDDGRISYEYIVQFYGVIASSELSCDVACQMKTVVFDPVTGGNYEESFGTTYTEDPGNEVSYRRFYFINIDAASAALLAANAAKNPALYNKSWPADPKGLFTVTGCTNSDYTAPDAMGYSTDPGKDPIISLPKTWDPANPNSPALINKQNPNSVQFSASALATSFATTAVTLGLGAAGGRSMGGQIAGAVAGGLAGEGITKAMDRAFNKQQPLGAAIENAVVGPISGTLAGGDAVFSVVTNNDYFNINHGPIYEVMARDNKGYIPNITFCGMVNTTSLLCSHELILRDTIDAYHSQNPSLHIKSINMIEPRGKDGCYYRFNTVSYDANTNTEGSVSSVGEVVRQYAQNDKSTCVFTPTNTFITDMSRYPIRSYYDIKTGTMAYPTRNIKSSATVQGRYIRVRPSTTGDGYLRISQIAVYDSTGINLALNRPVYASAPTYPGYGPPNLIVDGTYSSRSGTANLWAGGNNVQSHYIDIDLGKTYFINNVTFYGQLDIYDPTKDTGTRIEVLQTNEATAVPQKQLLTQTSNRIETVDFSTKMILPKLPIEPFQVPQPLPRETNLGSSCSSRCQDKDQIETMIQKYNSTNTTSQIMKVTKAVTPSANRCDYEVNMVRNKDGVKSVAKEFLSMTASHRTTTTTSTVVYGQIVRITAIPYTSGTLLNPLIISQVVIKNKAGENIALAKNTYATINNTKSANPALYGISSLVTDGTISLRTAPNYWSSGNSQNMSIDVDLGISRDIASITIYGAEGINYQGVTVKILNSVDAGAVALYSTTLPANQNTFTLTNFTACTFDYSINSSSFSFVQDTTPLLSSIDTSGGVLSFKGITDSVVGLYNTMVASVKSANPLKILSKEVTSANTAVSNIMNAAAANLQINGCPNTKCNDPAILTSISNRYNSDKAALTTQYGAETNVMSQITKAGVSGPNTCDVMFTNLYNFYDDALYPPTSTENSTMVKRFTMTNTGNCALQVTPGSAIIDISSNAVGIIPASSAVTPPFNVKPCQVNCRDPTLLRSVKTKMNSTAAGTKIPNFTSVLQSFANGSSTCEYMMTKDVTSTNSRTSKTTTQRGIQTYVTASFTMNASNCSFTLNSATEVDPELVTTTQDNITGLITAKINGRSVALPYLFNYDNTTPSPLVNETPLNL